VRRRNAFARSKGEIFMKIFLNFSMLAIVGLLINVSSFSASAQNRGYGTCRITQTSTCRNPNWACEENEKIITVSIERFQAYHTRSMDYLATPIYYCDSLKECSNKLIEFMQSKICNY
jgi:hypothetical protein